ncbi:hypothetical protein cypCar_00001078 [Cyprinus carpio]|nr:hypothetical protein cypCar_00001078 [Cyprinus carpio]
MAEFGNGLTEESLLDSDPGHSELEDPGVGDEEPGLDEGEAAIEDPELEAIKARVREMEEEAEKLKELQNEVEKQMNLSPPPGGLWCDGRGVGGAFPWLWFRKQSHHLV